MTADNTAPHRAYISRSPTPAPIRGYLVWNEDQPVMELSDELPREASRPLARSLLTFWGRRRFNNERDLLLSHSLVQDGDASAS